jgi:hypothetical protein
VYNNEAAPEGSSFMELKCERRQCGLLEVTLSTPDCTVPGNNPWTVHLLIDGKFACTGSLVSEDTAVFAKRCVQELE